jgi:drug/metabolite transporter (DMT)-like permease
MTTPLPTPDGVPAPPPGDVPGSTPDAVSPRVRRLSILLVAAVAIFWGLTWPLNKIALWEMAPLTNRALIVPISGLILLVFARASGVSLAVPRGRRGWLIAVTALNITGWMVCVAYGVANMAASRAVVIAYTMPLWASIFSMFFLGEAMTLRRVSALLLGMGGLVVLGWTEIAEMTAAPVGFMFTLGAAVFWASGMTLQKRIDWRFSTLTLTGYQLFLGGLPLVAAAFVLDTSDLTSFSSKAWGSIGFLICSMSLGYWAFFKVLSMLPASTTAISVLVTPVVGVLASVPLLGEILTWREMVALVLVVCALTLELVRSPGRA